MIIPMNVGRRNCIKELKKKKKNSKIQPHEEQMIIVCLSKRVELFQHFKTHLYTVH